MTLELDGREYSIESPETNARTAMDAINQYATDHDIHNSDGDLIQMEENYANPFYMILYGVGVLFNYVQRLLYSAACSLNIASASERQLLNIADIAGIKRRKATRTTIVGTLYSVTSAVDDPEPIRVTTDMLCTVATSQGTVTFSPAYEMTVPVGTARQIIFICNQDGAYALPADTITKFDVEPAGFRKLTTLASVPGQVAESIAELRLRLQRRRTGNTVIDRARNAIEGLEGVGSCNIYYNASIEDEEVVGGVTIPPRQACVFLQGYSNKVAETFYSYMLCQCCGAEHPNAVQQDYVSAGGQHLPVYLISPTQTLVHVRIYIQNNVTDLEVLNIQDTVMGIMSSARVGQDITSGELIKVLNASFPEWVFVGCQLSLDGTSWDYRAVIEPNQVAVFENYRIQVLHSDDK